MPWITLNAEDPNTALNPRAQFILFRDSNARFTQFQEVDRPFDTYPTTDRLSWFSYNNRIYGVGGLSENFIIDEHGRALRQGMQAYSETPTVAVGAGSTVQNCYIRFYDELTGERSPYSAVKTVTGDTTRVWTNLPTEEPGYVQQIMGTTTVSSSTTVIGTNTRFRRLRVGDRIAVSSAATTFVPITAINSETSLTVAEAIGDGTSQTITVRAKQRASHIEGWVGVSGLTPRLTWQRQLGVTSVTESISVLTMGTSDDSVYEPMPRGKINAVYHDRQLVAGVEGNPDTLYLSELFYPERWGALTYKTRNGEPITAIVPVRDFCLICTPNSSYILQGWTEDDFILKVSEPELGCANHWGIALIHGNAWVPNQKGIYLFNGAWALVNRDRVEEWRTEYKLYSRAFENGYGVHDPEKHLYKFCWTVEDPPTGISLEQAVTPPEDSWIWMIKQLCEFNGNSSGTATNEGTYMWVADYTPTVQQAGGLGFSQPNWVNHFTINIYRTQGFVRNPRQSSGYLLYGSDDKYLYYDKLDYTLDDIEGGDYNEPDDFYKLAAVMPLHQFFAIPGGGPREGKTLTSFWTHAKSEHQSFRVYALGGENEAGWVGNGALWGNLSVAYDEVAAAYKTDTETISGLGDAERIWQPKYDHYHVKPDQNSYLGGSVTGHGFTWLWICTNGADFHWFGVGGYYTGGSQYRGPKTLTISGA